MTAIAIILAVVILVAALRGALGLTASAFGQDVSLGCLGLGLIAVLLIVALVTPRDSGADAMMQFLLRFLLILAVILSVLAAEIKFRRGRIPLWLLALLLVIVIGLIITEN